MKNALKLFLGKLLVSRIINLRIKLSPDYKKNLSVKKEL